MYREFLLTVVVISAMVAAAVEAEVKISAYEVLRSHGLPIGLLPKGILNFTLDYGGRFEVRIEHPCTATFESRVRYGAVVSGELSYGQIVSLSGVSAEDLFLWFPVKGIFVKDPRSGIIFFDVGVVQRQFPLSLFEIPPDCEPDDEVEKNGLMVAVVNRRRDSREIF